MGHFNGLGLLAIVAIVAVITIVAIVRSPKAAQEQDNTEQQRDLITYYTTYRQRIFMAAFVCNVMGYGTNSQYFRRMRSSALIEFAAYGHLIDALENARHVMQIPRGEMSHETQEYFMAELVDNRGFILNCARYADFIAKLVDDAHVITTSWGQPIPDELIISQDTVDAFRTLRNEMWPSVDFNRQG
jgi:hypothetical protein